MDPITIATLLAKFGPAAFDLIRNLASIFTKEKLTPEEVVEFCNKSQKSYDQYIEEAKQTKLSL